jgi:hypothetical protein
LKGDDSGRWLWVNERDKLFHDTQLPSEGKGRSKPPVAERPKTTTSSLFSASTVHVITSHHLIWQGVNEKSLLWIRFFYEILWLQKYLEEA